MQFMSSFCSCREFPRILSTKLPDWKTFCDVLVYMQQIKLLLLNVHLLFFFTAYTYDNALKVILFGFFLESSRNCYFTGQQHVEYSHTTFCPEI